MKYLKLFEEHNNYYYQIDVSEFDDKTEFDTLFENGWDTTNWVDFNQSEISTIKGIFDDFFVFVGYSDFNPPMLQKDALAEYSDGMLIVNNKPYLDIKKDWSGTLFYVIKLPDEWYYTVDFKNQTFYKCDQFVGLLKFIEDKFLT